MAQQRLYAYNLTRQSFLSLGVRLAGTPWARLRGLTGRLKLRGDDGIWVVPSQGIHTFGLLFPIDVVYLDAQMRVIEVIEHVGPFRIGPFRRRCASVLELPTRSIFGSGTQAGDVLKVCSPEDLYAYWRAEPSSHPTQMRQAI
ncbi:MAG TPA: DUF192 domain-containing protein [Bryobacteraceae bacterium]|nr:DUF192 domain-containing protein [Bryobacteraceae bacterium]